MHCSAGWVWLMFNLTSDLTKVYGEIPFDSSIPQNSLFFLGQLAHRNGIGKHYFASFFSLHVVTDAHDVTLIDKAYIVMSSLST